MKNSSKFIKEFFLYSHHFFCFFHFLCTEEFSIYLNYVRKLGFEETPDYDFLRDLFTKVLKNNNEADDQIYDWNLLNGGRGWESQVVRVYSKNFRVLPIIEPHSYQLASSGSSQTQQQGQDRRREERGRREDEQRRRASAQATLLRTSLAMA